MGVLLIIIRGLLFSCIYLNLCVFGTPRGVYISVGVSPTRQLTIRAEVKGIVNSVRGYKLRDLYSSPRVASKQTVMRKREHTGFVKPIAIDEPSECGEICHCIEVHER